MSHPPATLRIMKKTPLHQGKKQPLKKHVAGSASDTSHGSQAHMRQGANGVTSNTKSRTTRTLAPKQAQREKAMDKQLHAEMQGHTLAPKHVQRDAEGGTAKGTCPADDAENGGRGADFDRRKDSASPVPPDTADGFRMLRRSHSSGTTNGAHPAGNAGNGGDEGRRSFGGRNRQDAAGARPSAPDAHAFAPGAAASSPGARTPAPGARLPVPDALASGKVASAGASCCVADALPPVFGVEAADMALEVLGRVSAEQMTPEELERLSTTLGRIRTRTSDLLRSVAAVALKDKDKDKGKGGKGVDAVHLLGGRAKLANREIRRLKRVAERLEEMPNTSERLRSGAITFEHAAALADAGAECGTESVDNDERLLNSAEKTPIDQYYKQTRSFAGRNAPDRGRARLNWQRRRRHASLYTEDDTGMGVIRALFDPISFNLLRQSVDRHTDALWREDGGRDGQPNTLRTPQQRCCDAIFELLTGKPAPANKPTAGDTARRPQGGRSSKRPKAGHPHQAQLEHPSRRVPSRILEQEAHGRETARQPHAGDPARRSHSNETGGTCTCETGNTPPGRAESGLNPNNKALNGNSKRAHSADTENTPPGERNSKIGDTDSSAYSGGTEEESGQDNRTPADDNRGLDDPPLLDDLPHVSSNCSPAPGELSQNNRSPDPTTASRATDKHGPANSPRATGFGTTTISGPRRRTPLN